MAGPMDGVKVVELGVWIAAPAAGGILADWGADVIKIEPPGVGDPARTFGIDTFGPSNLNVNPQFVDPANLDLSVSVVSCNTTSRYLRRPAKFFDRKALWAFWRT